MDLWTAIERRHSVRRFSSAAVPQSDIERILAAAVRAPSAGNRQPWHFIVVRNRELKTALATAAGGQGFVAAAPVVVVVCAEPDRSAARYGVRGRDLYCLQDTAAATEHVLLATTALGLGACWVGAFDETAAARALSLPATLRPVAMVPIGHPLVEGGRPSSRRSLEEVTSSLD
jgi:nitroreductase